MAGHFDIIGRMRADIADTVARFNARDVKGYMAKHAEDIQFAIPMLGGAHDAGGEWGRGRTAFADYLHLGFEQQGRLELLDVVAAGCSAGVLLVDSNGLRTETCLEFGPHGLVTRLFAFPLPIRGVTEPRTPCGPGGGFTSLRGRQVESPAAAGARMSGLRPLRLV